MSIVEEINELKKQKNAVILAHNYQLPEIQDLADFTGDSLGLSIKAAETDKDIIVFCGVYFMAETAKILSPQKTVLIPDRDAGCPMADMISGEELRTLKKEYPLAKVLCYVNTTAEVKAECDLCCTSSNAASVADRAFSKDDEIIFVPDKNLCHYVSTQVERRFIPWEGYCPVHEKILPKNIKKMKGQYPDAPVLVHRECTPEVIELSDKALSTEGMLTAVKKSNSKDFIIGTEVGILHRLKKENPGKSFYAASEAAICDDMKIITLEKVLTSLKEISHEVVVTEDISSRARNSIEKMVDYRD